MTKLSVAKPAADLPTEITLEIPLSFTLRRSPNGTWLPVVSTSGKAAMLAQANIPPRGDIAGAIIAALGLPDGSGAMVTGNVSVFLPKAKVPAEVWAKAVDRAAERANATPTPGAKASMPSNLNLA